MSSPKNINSLWVSTAPKNTFSQLPNAIQQQLAPTPVQAYYSPYSFEPVQKLWLCVSEEKAARQISEELKATINPIFSETDCCVDLSRENGMVRCWKSNWFVRFVGEWEVSVNVYNPQRCFDILGFIEKHKDIIVVFEAEGVNNFKG